MLTFRRIRRTIAAFLLILYLPGCYRYVTPEGMTPQEYIVTKHPKQVRVTLTDSSQLVLRKPWVSADSIGGFLEAWVQSPAGGWDWDKRDSTLTVPSGAVLRLEVGKPNDAEAVGIVLVVVMVGGFVGFVAAMSGMYGE